MKIFKEWYPYTHSECYMVMDPISSYKDFETKIVICPVDEGIEKAKQIAFDYFTKLIKERLEIHEQPTTYGIS